MTAQPTLAGARASGASAPNSAQARFLTGEAVYLEVRVARLGSRMLARLIDLFVQGAVGYALFLAMLFVLAILGSMGVVTLDVALGNAMIIVFIVLVFVGYPVLMETVLRGRTVGKLAMGLRVVRDDGGPIAFRQALTRNLVGLAVEWPGLIAPPLTWLAGIWTMIVSPQGKRLGDHAAGTVVIHERTPTAWGWVPQMPAGMAAWAATLDLAGLDDELALAVRHFLARNRSLREPARTRIGQNLAREVAAATNPPPPPGTPGWVYLAAVHAERHQRAMRRLAAVRARAATVWPDLSDFAPGAPLPFTPGLEPPPGYVPPAAGVTIPRPAAPIS